MQKFFSVKDKIRDSSYLRSVAFNTAWLFIDRFYRLGIGLIVGVWVARYLGPEAFGDINYSLAFVTIASVLTTLGLESIAIRELVKGGSKDGIIGTAFYSRMVVSVITILGLLGYVYLFSDESASRTALIIVFSFQCIFQSFDVIDVYFQSIVKSKFAVYARNIAFTVLGAYRIVLVLTEAPVLYFGVAILLETVLTAVLLVYYYQRKTDLSIAAWKFDFSLLKKMLADSWPLILANVSVILYMRLDQVMIGDISTSKDVGDYSAASRLLEVWYFVPTAIISSLYPYIIKAKEENAAAYEKKLLNLYSLMLWGSIIIAAVTTVLAKYLILILFGKEFMGAVLILQVYIWSLPASFLGMSTSQFLMAENLTRISFIRTFLGAIANIILNYILIPRYGGVGAAVATVISYSIASFSIVFFKSTRYQVVLIFKSLSFRRFINVLLLNDK